jgi:hypothetical protein
MWFDGQVDNGPLTSFLAHGTHALPAEFTLVHKYPAVDNFPGFFEPDVVRRPDGSYLAVVQRHFRDLYIGTGTDGVNFAWKKDVTATAPFFGRAKASNPGLVYDAVENLLAGLAFGMTDSPALVDHDIGFSVSQYNVRVRSPGNTWHDFGLARSRDEQAVMTFEYTTYDWVRITDPVTGRVVCDQSFATAAPGDIWHVQWNSEAPVIAMIEPDPDSVRARTEYVRRVPLLAGGKPVTWSVVEGPTGARIDADGTVLGWVPRHGDYGQLFAIQVRAQNAAGVHSRSWQIRVERGLPDFDADGDIDQSDFGYLQACLTATGRPQTDPACEGTDLDYDTDVDVVDLAKFIRCISGPNQSVSATCLD